MLAALALAEFEKFDSEASAKKNVRAAIEKVSARLGNTPSVCRRCYVHPEVIDSYMSDALVLEIEQQVERELRDNVGGLRPEEALALAFLQRRLSEKLAAQVGRSRQAPMQVERAACFCALQSWIRQGADPRRARRARAEEGARLRCTGASPWHGCPA